MVQEPPSIVSCTKVLTSWPTTTPAPAMVGSLPTEKSAGLSSSEFGVVAVYAFVCGSDGRFIPYFTWLVALAGKKFPWNCNGAATLPTGLPVVGSIGMPSRKYPGRLTRYQFASGWKSPRGV